VEERLSCCSPAWCTKEWFFFLFFFSSLLFPPFFLFFQTLHFQGWLHKGNGNVWKKRFFLLKDEYLYYFRSDESDAVMIGSIHLFMANVKEGNGGNSRKGTKEKEKVYLEIETSGKVYHMRTHTHQENTQWFSALLLATSIGLSLSPPL